MLSHALRHSMWGSEGPYYTLYSSESRNGSKYASESPCSVRRGWKMWLSRHGDVSFHVETGDQMFNLQIFSFCLSLYINLAVWWERMVYFSQLGQLFFWTAFYSDKRTEYAKQHLVIFSYWSHFLVSELSIPLINSVFISEIIRLLYVSSLWNTVWLFDAEQNQSSSRK